MVRFPIISSVTVAQRLSLYFSRHRRVEAHPSSIPLRLRCRPNNGKPTVTAISGISDRWVRRFPVQCGPVRGANATRTSTVGAGDLPWRCGQRRWSWRTCWSRSNAEKSTPIQPHIRTSALVARIATVLIVFRPGLRLGGQGTAAR
jgi:hypothetical protein